MPENAVFPHCDKRIYPSMARPLPKSIDETHKLLGEADYVADRSLATALYLGLAMQRPLFLEGEAGVGKTEIAKVISSALGRELIRLQCYEGLDIAQAAYEWNYSRQMIEIRLAEAAGKSRRRRSRRTSSRTSSSSSGRSRARWRARKAPRPCC